MSERIDIFCSWSGNQSKALAIEFKRRVETLWEPKLNFWISEEAITPGSISMEVLISQLNSARYGIAFITPENMDSKWIYFESGAISTKLGDKFLCPYLFGVTTEEINKTPLGNFQSLNGDRLGTFKLVQKLNQLADHPMVAKNLELIFGDIWNDLEVKYQNIQAKFSFLKETVERRNDFFKILSRLSDKLQTENNYIKDIVLNYMDDVNRTINDGVDTRIAEFLLPHTFYPFFLSDLLRRMPHTLTKAISIVDLDEEFWPEKTGNLILRYTNPKSIRVFAFKDNRQLTLHSSMLEEHAKSYNVYIISNYNLSIIFKPRPYDFCIIGDVSTSSLLARYDDEGTQYKRIKYSSDSESISFHNDLMSHVTDQSIKLESHDRLSDDFAKMVFQEMSPIVNKPVEMSSYISIHDYDTNEEKHAYYLEMMGKMIDIFNDKRNIHHRSKVLEIGAGTGIFTQRILAHKDIDYTGIEIDWACYHILLQKLKKISTKNGDTKDSNLKLNDFFKIESLNSTAECYNKDARTFDPPGKFNFIFSSFADHHIKIQDKAKYFKNIKRNLTSNGLFIVGDEFLPVYNENDPASRVNALKIYHSHIIEETLKVHGESANEFVKLESDALESGIQGLGDFKVSCKVYESHLQESGLEIVERILIGPQNIADKGGIYVYVIK